MTISVRSTGSSPRATPGSNPVTYTPIFSRDGILDAGYDSAKTGALLDELGCDAVISIKGFPLQAGARRVIERTNSWHNRGFKKLAICSERQTQVIDAFIALANAVIITRALIRVAWTTHRWDHPTRQTSMTYPRDL